MREINWNNVCKEYMSNMESHMYHMDDIGYPLDIIHDITYLLENKPDICFIFCNKYISTHILDMILDYKDNEKNEDLLSRIEYFKREMKNYKYCNILYKGKFHEYDLTYEFSQKDVSILLDFYKWQIDQHMKIYFSEKVI